MDEDKIISKCLDGRIQKNDKYCSVALALGALRDAHKCLGLGEERCKIGCHLLGGDGDLCNYRIGRHTDFSTPFAICALKSRVGNLYCTFDQKPEPILKFAKEYNLLEVPIYGWVAIDQLGCLYVETPYDDDWLAEIMIDLTKCKELQLVTFDCRIKYRISVSNDIFCMTPEMEIFRGFLFDQEEGGP